MPRQISDALQRIQDDLRIVRDYYQAVEDERQWPVDQIVPGMARERIHAEILHDMNEAMLRYSGEVYVNAVLTAIARGEIRHLTINYRD